MFQSMILSLVVLRKSACSGVSIGPGQTEFVRTPRRPAGREERSVCTATISLEKLYGDWSRSGRLVSNHSNGAAQPSATPRSRSALIGSLRFRHRLPAIDDVLTMAPPSG